MAAATSQAPRGRFDALDTLRCLAVLVMVQGHTFYLVMNEAVREQYWYRWHNYVHGYTAPAFLFGAGLAFGVTTLGAQLQAHATPGPTLYKRLYRYFGLFAIGYLLQLPPLQADMGTTTVAAQRTFFRVEALQHIGAALLVCQGLVVLLRERRAVVAASALLGLAIVLAGPYLSHVPFGEILPLGLSSYLTTETGSTFPLLPWVGFVFVGVASAALIPVRSMVGPSRGLVLGLTVGGLGAVGWSVAFDHLAPGLFGAHNYWKVSPYFFLRRVGWVLFALGAFGAIDRYWAARLEGQPGVLRRWVRLVSQHSLVVYVAHLWLLYGNHTHALRTPLIRNLGLAEGVALVSLIFALLLLLLFLWRSLEAKWETPFLKFRRGAVAAAAVVVLGTMVSLPPVAPEAAPPLAQAPAEEEAAEGDAAGDGDAAPAHAGDPAPAAPLPLHASVE